MNLLSPNDRFPLETPGIRLVDNAERHEWNGIGGEKIIYRRLCLADCKVEDRSVMDGIIGWTGFKLDGKEAVFERDLIEGLPKPIQTRVRAGVRAADFDTGRTDGSILYYRVPLQSVIEHIRRRATVQGKVNFSRYVPEMVSWALVDWENVYTSQGVPADFTPENVGKLPLGAIDIIWDKISDWIAGEEEREERELKNSTPTSGD